MENDNYIEELYHEFLEAVADGTASTFEMEDLLEIYDYATDISDDYTRMFAMAVAFRKSPHNRQLRERMAFMLYDNGDIRGVRRMIRDIPAVSPIRRILEIGVSGQGKDEMCRSLDNFIGNLKKGELDDESVIRLIDLVSDHSLFDWLKLRYATVKQCSMFHDTVLNEIAGALEENSADSDFRQQVLEDYVEEFPLSESAWSMLAEFYINVKGDFNLAENAVNNAMAIAPENVDLRVQFVQLLMNSCGDHVRTQRAVDSLYQDYPDNEDVVYHKSLLEFSKGNSEAAVAVLERQLKKNPGSVLLYAQYLLERNGLDCSAVSDAFVSAQLSGGTDAQLLTKNLMAAARGLRVEDNFGALAELYHTVDRLKPVIGELLTFDDKIECFYRGGRYMLVVELCSAQRPETMQGWSDVVVLCYALAMRRLGMVAELTALISACKKGALPSQPSEGYQNLMRAGLWYYLCNIESSLTDDKTGPEMYDPFSR